jgi:PAS domain S-box-containing protein
MTVESDEGAGAAPIEQARAGGVPQRFGWYRFYFADERWEWSPEVEAIHGYRPGTAHPTTEMVLGHKHPDDIEQVSASLAEIRRTRGPFSTRHRIVAVDGAVRDVVVIGERLHNESGEVVGTQGFYIDVTRSDRAREAAITEMVSEIAENRAVIEQVKGVLSMVYRIDPDVAFDLLKWRSQHTNVKLRVLAQQLVNDFSQMGGSEHLPSRSAFDRVLLTAHQRIRADSALHR